MLKRDKKGQLLAETAASMAVLLALGVLVLFVVTSMSFAYMVKADLAEAARVAARDLAIAYGKDPTVAASRAAQEAAAYDRIRIPNIIVSSDQFDDAIFATGSNDRSVTVRLSYQGSRWGLPPFPTPDPLKIGRFTLTAESVYRLE